MLDPAELVYMRLAIGEATNSRPEDERIHPKVGVVVVKDGRILAKAHRGEVGDGEHAEFVALERKLKEQVIAGATVYTTLEPCNDRTPPKIACALRLAERRVKRVVIGMLDLDRRGQGYHALREAGIEVEHFPPELLAEIEDMNRDFMRNRRRSVGESLPSTPLVGDEEKIPVTGIETRLARPLDEWYRALNEVYWNQNLLKSEAAIFTHLVEVVGGLSHLASKKRKKGVVPQSFVPKALAWWMALCGKLRIRSVSDMVWAKFPGICAYCHRTTHDLDECRRKKDERKGPDWESLERRGRENDNLRPTRLGGWQTMFATIYPVNSEPETEYGPAFARLTEELGELAEAIRVFPAAPGYVLSEASDVFAWLMRIQNLVDAELRETSDLPRGIALERAFAESYPDRCLDCGYPICRCPTILDETVGRIAHEVPTRRQSFGTGGSFLTMEDALVLFQPSKRQLWAAGPGPEGLEQKLTRILLRAIPDILRSSGAGIEDIGLHVWLVKRVPEYPEPVLVRAARARLSDAVPSPSRVWLQGQGVVGRAWKEQTDIQLDLTDPAYGDRASWSRLDSRQQMNMTFEDLVDTTRHFRAIVASPIVLSERVLGCVSLNLDRESSVQMSTFWSGDMKRILRRVAADVGERL